MRKTPSLPRSPVPPPTQVHRDEKKEAARTACRKKEEGYGRKSVQSAA